MTSFVTHLEAAIDGTVLPGRTIQTLHKGRPIWVRYDLDANGTDGTAAFQLPDPDPDGDGVTWYGVYLRPKGKPGQSMNLTTCGSGDFDNDPLTPDEELCSLEVAIAVRGTGKPKVQNVSRELLSMCVDTDGDMKCDERIFLFDDRAHDYLWSVDNFGLRNAEVRFLEIPQTIGTTP